MKEEKLNEKYFDNKIIYKRAKHVVSENQRVLRCKKKTLLKKNIRKFWKFNE